MNNFHLLLEVESQININHHNGITITRSYSSLDYIKCKEQLAFEFSQSISSYQQWKSIFIQSIYYIDQVRSQREDDLMKKHKQ